jgi:hypothetical protein
MSATFCLDGCGLLRSMSPLISRLSDAGRTRSKLRALAPADQAHGEGPCFDAELSDSAEAFRNGANGEPASYVVEVCREVADGRVAERPRVDSIADLEAAGSLHAAERIRHIKGRRRGKQCCDC